MSELGRLSGKVRRRRRVLTEWGTVMRHVRTLREDLARMVMPSIVTRTYYASRIEADLTRLRDIREALAEVEADIYKERWELAQKIIPPPIPPEELIAPEEITGYNIYYHTQDLNYPIRHPDTNELIRTESELVIEITGSVETRTGHDVPMVLEITAITTVAEADLAEITRITRRNGPIETAVINYLKGEGWGPLARALDTIDEAFLGKSIEEMRGYPCVAPDYPTIAIWLERRSRFIRKRRYPSSGCDEIEAEE